jgi:hypothetical protein
MVMVDSAPTRVAEAHEDGESTLHWESVAGVEPAAWVGRVRGTFVGMIEARWQEGFTATTRLGRKIGTYATLEDAEEAFIVKHR